MGCEREGMLRGTQADEAAMQTRGHAGSHADSHRVKTEQTRPAHLQDLLDARLDSVAVKLAHDANLRVVQRDHGEA